MVKGLREQKKRATREALREAALRLALEHGPDRVRVDDIAEAAGVSPRTYNNYFPSREHAIVAAVTAEREERVAAAVAARSSKVRLVDAVIEGIVEQFTDSREPAQAGLLMITTSPTLREVFASSAGAMENPLAGAIAERIGDPQTARVLAASVAAAVRIALTQWIQPTGTGLVVPKGSLPDLLRAALAPLAPALDAAENAAVGATRKG